jgi:hypothetical protein
MGKQQQVTDLDRQIEAAEDLRALIRDAHAAVKDLRAAVREAKAETAGLAEAEAGARIRAEVDQRLTAFAVRVEQAAGQAAGQVLAGFDRYGESLLGKETYWARAAGRRDAEPPAVTVPGDLAG